MRLNPRLLAAAASVVVIGSAGGWAWLSGAASEAMAAVGAEVDRLTVATTASAGMRLSQITVEGRGRTAVADLLAAIDLPQGAPVMALDPAAARERIESLQWVKEAVVERRLPDTVHVRLVERLPIALWQREDGRYVMIDADGAVIEDDIRPFAALPVISGTGAPEAASDLFTMLAVEHEIAPRVKAAVRVGQRRWNLWLDAVGADGLEVRLPEAEAERALGRLAEMERESRILRRDLSMIDLRLEDRLVVQVRDEATPPDGAQKAKRAKGQKTDGPLPLNGPAQDA